MPAARRERRILHARRIRRTSASAPHPTASSTTAKHRTAARGAHDHIGIRHIGIGREQEARDERASAQCGGDGIAYAWEGGRDGEGGCRCGEDGEGGGEGGERPADEEAKSGSHKGWGCGLMISATKCFRGWSVLLLSLWFLRFDFLSYTTGSSLTLMGDFIACTRLRYSVCPRSVDLSRIHLQAPEWRPSFPFHLNMLRAS